MAIPRRLALFCKAFVKPGRDPDSVSFLASREYLATDTSIGDGTSRIRRQNNATAAVCYLIVEQLERLSTGWLPSTRTSLRRRLRRERTFASRCNYSRVLIRFPFSPSLFSKREMEFSLVTLYFARDFSLFFFFL